MKSLFLTIILLITIYTLNAQTSILNISSEIELPKDSLDSKRLVSSLNKFLIAAQADAKKNEWVYQPEFLQTSLLLDEIEGIEIKEQQGESIFYEPYLLDVNAIENQQFIVKIAYIGTTNNKPSLRANLELIAHKNENKFLFSSPLARNTKHWQSTTLQNITFYYLNTFDLETAEKYQKLRTFYDNKLKIEPKEVSFYPIPNELVPQDHFGLPYKLDYNGNTTDISWSVFTDTQEIYLLNTKGFTEFDPHDLWHNRLNQVTSRRKVNHAVDEGIATLYGGSWGLNWQDMFTAFKNQIKFDKNTDWLDLRENKIAFITDGHRNPTDFMVNALFVKKIENEKGFSSVWELLNAKEETIYFKTLERLTGITINNYNKEVWKLIKEEIKTFEQI